jgi:hypothetical protein
MFGKLDFEIFDEPGLEVPDGAWTTANGEHESPAAAVSSDAQVKSGPARDGTDQAPLGLNARPLTAQSLDGGLAGRGLRCTAAVAALVLTSVAAVSLLPDGDPVSGSGDGPGETRRRLAPWDAPARPAAALGPRLRRRVSRAARGQQREKRRLHGRAATDRAGAPTAPPPSAPPPTTAAPSPPVVVIPAPEPAPVAAPNGPLPAPAAPPSPFEP